MALDIKVTYEKALKDMGHGFPLFSPGKVELGDVGFIDSDGTFRTFYNIANPPKGPGGPKEVCLERVKDDNYMLGPMHMCQSSSVGGGVSASPQGVNQVSAADNVVKFTFSNVRQNSVVLIPWPEVNKESLKHVGNLEEYFSTHRYWLKDLCKKEGIQWDQLILVIGTLKTRDWAIAVNLVQDSTVELTFTIGGQGANVWGNWSGLESSSKTSKMRPTAVDSDDDLNLNTTIFIHRILPKGVFGTPTMSRYKPANLIKRELKTAAHKLFGGKDKEQAKQVADLSVQKDEEE